MSNIAGPAAAPGAMMANELGSLQSEYWMQQKPFSPRMQAEYL